MTATSSSSSKANGAAEAPDWATWPTERQAAKQLRTSNTQLRSIVAKLGLAPVKAFDGSNRYSPDLLAQVERTLRVAEEISDDEDAPSPLPTEATVIRELITHNRECRAHIEKLMGLITGPMSRMLESYDRHQDRSETRIGELEKSLDAANAKRAETLDEEEARALVRKEVNEKLDRRRELFGVVKDRLPSILEAVETSFGLGVGSREKMQAAGELLQSLEPAQVTVLLDPALTFLKPQQRAAIRKMLGLEPETPPQSDAPSSEPSNDTKTPTQEK